MIRQLVADLTSGDEKLAEAAVQALAGVGEAALPALSPLLDAGEAETRWWAVRAIAELPGRAAAACLLQALADPQDEVRCCALLALRQKPNLSALPRLINALQGGSPLAAHLAGDALVALHGAAVPALLEVLQGNSQSARVEAARALAQIGDTRAIPALYALLDEDSVMLEYWANEGLEKMGVGMVYFKP